MNMKTIELSGVGVTYAQLMDIYNPKVEQVELNV